VLNIVENNQKQSQAIPGY